MMPSKIKKRDGRIVDFESGKIAIAIGKAFAAVGEEDGEVAGRLAEAVVEVLDAHVKGVPSVEAVQDIVEEVLIKDGYAKVAKAYILYRQKRAELREAKKFLGVIDDLKLGVNAIKVLEKRYLLRDENLKVVETPSMMFRRVARTIAAVDKIYDPGCDVKKVEEEFYSLMADLEFLPNSPTLMNAGTEVGQLSACFVPEQPVFANPGFKSINQIKAGDSVVTHTGKLGNVTRTFERDFDGFIHRIKVRGLLSETLAVTPEHPVLAVKREDVRCIRNKYRICNGFSKKYCHKKPREHARDCEHLRGDIAEPQWTAAGLLEEGDYVAVSTIKEVKDVEKIRVIDFLPVGYEVVEDQVLRKNTDRRLRSGRYSSQVKAVKNDITVDKELMLLFGYYLSEGDVTGNCVRFTLGEAEKGIIGDITRIVKKKFGVETRIEKSRAGKWVNLRFHSTILAQLFKALFGSGFDKKDIPGWMLTLPPEKQFYLLVGIFRGDGCHCNRKKQDVIYLSLSNCALSMNIWSLLTRLGYPFNISTQMPKNGTAEAYRISAPPSECPDLAKAVNKNTYVERKRFPQYIKLDGWTLRRVDKIEKTPYRGKVYNLEVEGEHAYLANGVAVHNCFVLPIPDSVEDIFNALKYMALIHQSGGGTGFSFSRIRPKGDLVKSTKGVASGPISFMRAFDMATEIIKQGGRRRGANMGILRVDHPDILEFIPAKGEEGILSNFNVSVAVTEDFMRAVEKDERYPLVNPRNGEVVKKLRARDVLDLIVTSAWRTGDPGIIFIDEINRHNPTPQLGEIESTNPCAEEPLLPYESCNLGSINLVKMVRMEEGGAVVDYEKLGGVVRSAVHFLDNVIDVNKYPLKEIERITKGNRKVGLGVMGFAQLLLELGIPYNSEEALKKADEIMGFITKTAREASAELAEERGSFPNYEGSVWGKRRIKVRNAAITTIAPTGTLSIIASTSSGIEPIFAVSFYRSVMGGTRLLEVNPVFERIARERGFYSNELLSEIARVGSIQGMKEIPLDVRRLFVTALDIAPEWHVRMQSVFQKHVDSAVSKTVNLPNDATLEDVKKVYLLAHRLKCKGITIYRYGSKMEQVLYIGPVSEAEGVKGGNECPL